MTMRSALLSAVLVAAALCPPATQAQVALPSEPDYEAEKLQFQRGSLLYYGLPETGGSPAGEDIDALREAAAAGDAAARLRLGQRSEQGRGMPQDYRAAIQWYEKAAPHSADAQFLLGLMHYQGKGVPQDFMRAQQWFESAAAKSTQAQVNLGWMCEYGQGGPDGPDGRPDFACARRRYEQAAEAGDALGMFNAGTLHYLGKGVAQDYAAARQWFLRAADRNFPAAQYNLGVMALGQGQARNPLEAYQWFRLVQLASYPGGSYNIDKVSGELSIEQKQQAEHWVRQWQAAHPAR
jgi:uncharacterized protein